MIIIGLLIMIISFIILVSCLAIYISCENIAKLLTNILEKTKVGNCNNE